MIPPGFRYAVPLMLTGRRWLNSNDRIHPMLRAKVTKQWREHAEMRARLAHLPHLGRAHVFCELLFHTRARRDPGNWYPTAKACVDGLVDAGLFTDDDAHHIVGPDMRLGPVVPKPFRGLVLHLYPLPLEV